MNQPLPQNAAREAELYRQLAQVPPQLRGFIAKKAIDEQRTVLQQDYWSTVRVRGTVAANVLTVDTTVRKAFAYSIGQTMEIAGFAAASGAAQGCDTNLLRPSETLDNAEVYIYGLGVEICQNSEPVLAARLFRECELGLSLNGTQSIRIGTLGMFPAGGGIYGAGRSFAAESDFAMAGPSDGGAGAQIGFVSNGNPLSNNFRQFKDPFIWTSVGSNGGDSSLVISVQPDREITIPLAASRVAAAGVAAWTQPATGDLGTFCDFRLRLFSISLGARSKNV